jgi:hypothetical protein
MYCPQISEIALLVFEYQHTHYEFKQEGMGQTEFLEMNVFVCTVIEMI